MFSGLPVVRKAVQNEGHDLWICQSIDTRPKRSRTRDLLNILETVRQRGAGFQSLSEHWADTTTAQGRLILTFLGGIAEFERELIRARSKEGMARAKACGVKFGRKPKLTAHQKREAIKRRDSGKESLAYIGLSYNVSGWTIGRLKP